MPMRHNLDSSLDDTVGRLKSNDSQCSDIDMYDGSQDSDHHDTDRRLDNSQGNDAG